LRFAKVSLRDAFFHQRDSQSRLLIADSRTRNPHVARELTVVIGCERLLDIVNDLSCCVLDVPSKFVVAVEPFTSRQLPHVRPQLIG